MFCPEGYFTPKMFETDLRASVAKAAVRNVVYTSSGQSESLIEPVHLDQILDALAKFFLCHFVLMNSSKARLCNPKTSEVVRVDPWALTATSTQRTLLPLDMKTAMQTVSQSESLFAFVDQEFWVLDFEKIRSLNDPTTASVRLVHLFEGFDGWSICFPKESHPADNGAFMKGVAEAMAISRASIPIRKNPVGRTRKIDTVVRCIDAAYPDGLADTPAKVVHQKIKGDLGFSVSETTLGKAIRTVKSAQKYAHQ